MERHRFVIALGVALAVHVLAFWWWAEQPAPDKNMPLAKVELVLTQISPAQQPSNTVQEPEKVEVLPESQAQTPPAPEVKVQPAPEEVNDVATALVKPDTSSESAASQLDLTRPDDWSEVMSTTGSAEDFARAFRGDFYRRLEQRQNSKARSQLLAGRQVAQRGLAPQDYNALERPGSGHYKTDAGCFDMKADIVGTIGGAQRAWIAACKDLIQSPFQLPTLEFDALGRAVPR